MDARGWRVSADISGQKIFLFWTGCSLTAAVFLRKIGQIFGVLISDCEQCLCVQPYLI